MPKGKAKLRSFSFFVNNKGVNEDSGEWLGSPQAAASIVNMHPTREGEYSSHDQGYTNVSSQLESGARVETIATHTSPSGTEVVLASINGKVVQINSGSFALEKTLVTDNLAGDPIDFQTFLGNVYIAGETIEPRMWDGLSPTAASMVSFPLTIGSYVFTKPPMIEAYSNRLAYADDATVLLSDVESPDSFTFTGASASNAFHVGISRDDGQKITGLRTWYVGGGQDRQLLVVFKERSVYTLSGLSPDTFRVSRVATDVGALNQRSVVEIGGQIFFLGDKIIYSMSQVAQTQGPINLNSLNNNLISQKLESMNLNQRDKMWAIHLPDRKEAWFGIVTGSNLDVDTILVYSYRNKGPTNGQWSVKSLSKLSSVARLSSGQLLGGSTDGYIQRWFNTSTYAGTGYNWSYRYDFTDFGAPSQIKRIQEMAAYLIVRSSVTITINTSWRLGGGSVAQSSSLSVPVVIVGDTNAVYGTAVYNTDVYSAGGTTGTGGVLKKIQLPSIRGFGNQFQFQISGTNENVGVDFLGIEGRVEFGKFSRRYN